MTGVIDEDYRGEVKALLVNLSDVPVRIEKGDRVAQLILERISTPDTEEVDDLAPYATDRGTGGFGSTGVAGSLPAAAAAAATPGQYAVEVTRKEFLGIGKAVLYMPTERK
jgi:dUTP pyrophosphatase